MKQLLVILVCVIFIPGYGQQKRATFKDRVVYAREVPSLASRTSLIPSSDKVKEYNPKLKGTNKVVPGKGYPKWGQFDPVGYTAKNSKVPKIAGIPPTLTFEAASSGATPTDPTGAVGPNHYVNAWNSSFAIYDKSGNVLMPASSLENIWPNETTGDPIVFYDNFAERFVITQFDGGADDDPDNGFLIAVCQGDDPVNDGWFTFRYRTGNTFPDYPKFSIWSDGYYITCNKDSGSADTNEVVYALERDKLLVGDDTAQIVGFPLPGISTNGFFSPAGFNAIGAELPPVGNKPIIYLQDDAWAGVTEDALKMWSINVDWTDTDNSTITESQELTVSNGDITAFDSVFDGGDFANLEQPSGPDMDALQATIMYMTNYRRFATYNTAVLNFVIDLTGVDEVAAIRWYELRQTGDGQPWTVYQEGTYVQPTGDSAFSGAMGIDKFGNIALAYTVVSKSTFPSLRYTGRFASDDLGEMTLQEEVIVNGDQIDPATRYGDYAQMTIDPTDDRTFWYIGEYFGENTRKNHVGVFGFQRNNAVDVGVVGITPKTGTLSDAEEITVVIRNFGTEEQTDIPVSLSVEGGAEINGVVPSVLANSEAEFTFPGTFDFSAIGENFEITSSTNLTTDLFDENDILTNEIKSLAANDIGVDLFEAPFAGSNLGQEDVTVVLKNFGGENQTGFNVSYSINGAAPVTEIFNGALNFQKRVSFTFSTKADMSANGIYEFCASTSLTEDFDQTNNVACKSVANLNCVPVTTDGCGLDGVKRFALGSIDNASGCGTDNGDIGYTSFLDIETELNRSLDNGNGPGVYIATIQSNWDGEAASIWVDFNDNFSFEPSEQLLSNGDLPTAGVAEDFEIALPADAPLGSHILRVKAIDPTAGGTGIDDPCGDVQYGETEDYLVTIIDSALSVDQLAIKNADFTVISPEKDQFIVALNTSLLAPVRITVHNMLGQTVMANRMSKTNEGYQYALDMSYAASGPYLIRVGTENYGMVKKIVVQ